jgi:signal peptidase I
MEHHSSNNHNYTPPQHDDADPYDSIVTSNERSHDSLKSTLSTLLILLVAPLVALLLTAFVFQSYEVDGPSMQTTLSDHDRLIVFKVQKTVARVTGHPFLPNRGDIIVFNKQGLYDFNSNTEKQLIKRVIGLPGDRIIVQDGTLTVYNAQHPDGFEPDKTMSYGKVIVTTPGNIDVTVGKNELFVCGDNRQNSLDSRSFGPINASDVVGKLGIRISPLSKTAVF